MELPRNLAVTQLQEEARLVLGQVQVQRVVDGELRERRQGARQP